MSGIHDNAIQELFNEGCGGQIIASKLNLNQGYVGRRMKVMGLNTGRKNQYTSNTNLLQVVFEPQKAQLSSAAEHYLKFLCDLSGHNYADPPAYEPYDLLVDFGSGWQKIQVKSSCGDTFDLCRRRINTKESKRIPYEKHEVEWFFLFRSDYKCWLVPFSEVARKCTVRAETMLPGFEIKLTQ